MNYDEPESRGEEAPHIQEAVIAQGIEEDIVKSAIEDSRVVDSHQKFPLDVFARTKTKASIVALAIVFGGAPTETIGNSQAEASRAKTHKTLAPHNRDALMKPAKAYMLGDGGSLVFAPGPRYRGSFLKEQNDSIGIYSDPANGIRIAQEQIDSTTRWCQDEAVGNSVGKQELTLKKGRKNLRLVSNIYDAEQFALGYKRGYKYWSLDCEEVINTEYTLQAVVKRGKKKVLVGNPITITNNDGTDFDGWVREYRRKPVRLQLDRKITNNDIKKKRIGYRTTVSTRPVDSYPGQIVSTTIGPKSKSWTRYIRK